jgi:hypothetical protein
MRCKSPACKQKLPKGSKPPLVCNDACRDAAIAHALAKKRAADQRAAARAKNLVEREAKEQRKAFRRKKQEFYENDYRHQFKLTLEAAKALCRVLDIGKPCISCGTRADIQYAAGHYKSAGAHPELALDLRNLHRQCNRNCNCGLSGNISGTKTTAGYRAGLQAAYGEELVAYLEKYHAPRKFSCRELMDLRQTYHAEVRRLKKGLGPSRDWRKLPEASTEVKTSEEESVCIRTKVA